MEQTHSGFGLLQDEEKFNYMRMQTVEWESFYIICSWTELHELITIVVEYLIVSKLGSILEY